LGKISKKLSPLGKFHRFFKTSAADVHLKENDRIFWDYEFLTPCLHEQPKSDLIAQNWTER